MVRDSKIPLQGAWVQPLVGELTSSQEKKKGRRLLFKNSQKGSSYKPQERQELGWASQMTGTRPETLAGFSVSHPAFLCRPYSLISTELLSLSRTVYGSQQVLYA